MTQPGPCVLCGVTDYPLSMGGPGICPTCDCGVPPGETKLRRQHAAKLHVVEAERDALRAENAVLREALERVRDHTILDAADPELRAQNECNYRRAVQALASTPLSAKAAEVIAVALAIDDALGDTLDGERIPTEAMEELRAARNALDETQR